jgi:hypothetical protein
VSVSTFLCTTIMAMIELPSLPPFEFYGPWWAVEAFLPCQSPRGPDRARTARHPRGGSRLSLDETATILELGGLGVGLKQDVAATHHAATALLSHERRPRHTTPAAIHLGASVMEATCSRVCTNCMRRLRKVSPLTDGWPPSHLGGLTRSPGIKELTPSGRRAFGVPGKPEAGGVDVRFQRKMQPCRRPSSDYRGAGDLGWLWATSALRRHMEHRPRRDRAEERVGRRRRAGARPKTPPTSTASANVDRDEGLEPGRKKLCA